MKSSALVFWVLLAVVGSVAYGSWVAWKHLKDQPRQHAPATQHGIVVVSPEKGPPIKHFQLTERSGRQFDSKELDGKPWVASVFFANCPGSCWQMNQALRGVQDDFKGTDLRLVSVTCDPDNDTPAALQVYANRLQADPSQWLFLTGDLKYIQRIGRDVLLQEITPASHNFSALLIDRDGRVRGSYSMLDPKKIAELKTDARKLLDEKPAADEQGNTDKQDKSDEHR